MLDHDLHIDLQLWAHPGEVASIGAAGMLALVLAGFGAAQTFRSVPSR
jgi:hypothetical protein